MKKILVLQLSLFVFCAAVFGGLAVSEDMYSQVQTTIVNILCLSCIKINPATTLDFTFETANAKDHPSFITENLTQGVVFLVFREDVCPACDRMEPAVQEVFEVHFEKEDTVVATKTFNGITVTLIHITFNHSPRYLIDSYGFYDKNYIGGVPMFTVITHGYNRGFIQPYYATLYGDLGETLEQRMNPLHEMIHEAVNLYHQNH